MSFRWTLCALAPLLLILAALCTSCSEEEKGNPRNPGGQARPAAITKGSKGGAVEFADDFQRIRIEAEDAVKIEGDLMHIVADPDASGGKCIEIPDKVGKPEDGKFARAVYKLQVKVSGHYTFWCRRKWLDACGDTLAVRFDQVGRPHAEAALFGGSDSKPVRWAWSPVYVESGKVQQFYLAAGEHVMEILNREDGPRVDVILLTDDPDYVPQGMEN